MCCTFTFVHLSGERNQERTSQKSINQGTARLAPHRRQTTRWSHLNNMASGKVPLGCNFAGYPSRPTPQRYIQESRSSSGASSKLQNREIPRTDSQIPLRTGSRGDTRPNQRRRKGRIFVWSWVTNPKDLTKSSRNMSHFPKNFVGGSKGKRFIFRRMFPGGGVVVGLTVFVCLWGFRGARAFEFCF